MRNAVFYNDDQSHQHSRHTLESLYEYDDFMGSVTTVADMGCGTGLDLEWWATRTTRDEKPRPLNIKCTGIDLSETLAIAHKYKNITYQQQNFEDMVGSSKKRFDVLWCHNSFQYAVNPLNTLKNWYSLLNENGMLVLIVPQTTNIEYNVQCFDLRDYQYFNYTMVNLIYMLAVNGFDCQDGFFYKDINDPWLHAVVYKSTQAPRDPRTTRWIHLAEANLLPRTAVDSVNRWGYVKQQDLVLPWLDRSLHAMRDQ